MCLILIAKGVHPRYRLILAANRDEFYHRPTLPVDFWDDAPDILAGKDLEAGGTWLGITRTGRLAAITNFRDPDAVIPQARSRGKLVSDYLGGSDPPQTYLNAIRAAGQRYNGFNLIAGAQDDLRYYSNRNDQVETVPDGIHGLSNRFLNTPWPKVTRGRAGIEQAVAADAVDSEALFALLGDRTTPSDRELPSTGVGLEWERLLAPLFISSTVYGTRSSSIVLIDVDDTVTFLERTFRRHPSGKLTHTTRRFEFQLST